MPWLIATVPAGIVFFVSHSRSDDQAVLMHRSFSR